MGGAQLSIVSEILRGKRHVSQTGRFTRLSTKSAVVRSFLNKDEARALRGCFLEKAKLIKASDTWAASRIEFFNTPEAMQHVDQARPLVEAAFSQKVQFSYNFTSVYVSDVSLKAHVDRPGCDVNFIIYLGDDGADVEMPIIELQDDGRHMVVRGTIGDAIVFPGRELVHSRERAPSRSNLITTIIHFTW